MHMVGVTNSWESFKFPRKNILLIVTTSYGDKSPAEESHQRSRLGLESHNFADQKDYPILNEAKAPSTVNFTMDQLIMCFPTPTIGIKWAW